MSINKVGLISRWAHQISSAIVAGGSILASIAIRQPDNTYNVAQFAKIMSILGLIAFISGHMNIHLNLRASQIGNASYKYKLMMVSSPISDVDQLRVFCISVALL